MGIIIEDQTLCPFYKFELESVKLVFFNCNLIWRIWMEIGKWWSVSLVLHKDASINIVACHGLVRGKQKKAWWTILFFKIIWSIWFNRNKWKIKALERGVEEMVEEIKYSFSFWIKTLCPELLYTYHQFQDNLDAILRCNLS